ncbi:uncharacterized protein EV422DRAFT_565671 [Fimicolochytrium jonesii]|uniref:uncharacterized protein n=1 Tax=Fimicolochytrium jonesii TaxID=1396493 RepID=UPI0022FDF6F0|nr:uncharacterized protein EV422DRAFT_565671 [Fimicolochytrium jonesii]KAI8823755.1 hypothetical protein EV422DRAFT_565671 [Fimicolochytrium jonesii]
MEDIGRCLGWTLRLIARRGSLRPVEHQVAQHEEEMRLQPDKASSSILQWVSVYNRYISFFVRNFGEPANVLGKQHMTQVIATLRSILCKLFPDHGGDTVRYLNDMTRKRFPLVSREAIPGADPETARPTNTSTLRTALAALRAQELLLTHLSASAASPHNQEWTAMNPYWQWVFCHYGGKLLIELGSLAYFNRKLIPLGMISALKSARLKWK